MLRAKREERSYRRVVTALNIAAEKLSALRKSDRVEAAGELGNGGELVTYRRQLGVYEAEEACGAVRRGVFVEVDGVDEGAGVCLRLLVACLGETEVGNNFVG